MLTKLFKHEVKATARLILPFDLGLVALTAVMCLFSALSPTPVWMLLEFNAAAGLLFGVVMVVFFILIAAVFIVTFIVMLTRFYKNIYGDEGYLMHTLPVSAGQLLAAKMLCSAMWNVVAGLVVIPCLFFFFFSQMPAEIWAEMKEIFGLMASELAPYLTGADGALAVLIGIEYILILLLTGLTSPLSMYFCISLGQLMTKHPVLGAFLSYLGLTTVLQTVTTSLGTAAVMTGLLDVIGNFFMDKPLAAAALSLAGALLAELALGLVYFFANRYLMTRKLNLS